MIKNYNLIVKKIDFNKRLDSFLSDSLKILSRTKAQSLILNENVLVNGKKENKNYLVKENDRIFVSVPETPEMSNAKPEKLPINIIYEDEDILLVNKAKGMVVHPAAGHWSGTLVNALLFHCNNNLSNVNGPIRPGIVHRIDKDTSGILIVAKNNLAHQFLAEQIKSHSFKREYEAVVHGNFKNKVGEINLSIGRDIKDRKKFSVTLKNSKPAITLYKVINENEKYSHLRITLKTGRTHQIRVHMAYINHPVAGDALYGLNNISKSEKELFGQCLHARYIGFVHPKSKKFIEFEVPLPNYFKKFLKDINIKC